MHLTPIIAIANPNVTNLQVSQNYHFMRRLGVGAVLAGAFLFLTSAGWRTDFEKAKFDAKAENKLILLKFSGSDWCLPCIKMENDVFSKDTFQHFAAQNLEMVNADFPRLKKHELAKYIVSQNEALAEHYDKDGHFPYTVLLNADGKVLKAWDGYKGEKPEALIGEMQKYVAKGVTAN